MKNNTPLLFLILFLFCFTRLSAHNKLTIEEVSRQTSPEVTEKVRFEILSSEENLSVRTTESFDKTLLSSGEYSYVALFDPELATRRKVYISAPLVIETEYNVSGLKAGEHIVIRVNAPRTELTVEPKPNLTPSKNSTAIYQFYATIPDLKITTDSGLQFESKGKDQSAFYIYELIVEVKDTHRLNLTIRADGYDEITYTIDDVSQRIYGFFVFPKNAEECFNKNYSIGDEYYKDGLYDEAERYYRLAKECSDRDHSVDIDTKLKDVSYCSTIRKRINNMMLRADILEKQPANLDNEVDSVYWYRSNIIDGLKLLQRKNPADDFCSATSIASLENDLKNSSRYIGGLVTDLEFTNQVLANVIIYGSEKENANPKSMVRLGESGADGKFKVQVPNKYTILYFEHGRDKDYNKPVRVNITNGKVYKYHVKLQRKVITVGF